MRKSILEIIGKYCGKDAVTKILDNKTRHDEFFLKLPTLPDEERLPTELELIDIYMIMSVARKYISGDSFHDMMLKIGVDCLINNQGELAVEIFTYIGDASDSSDIQKGEALSHRAEILLRTNEWDLCKEDLIKTIIIFKNNSHDVGLARSYGLMAVWHIENGLMKDGMQYLNQLLDLNEKLEDASITKNLMQHLSIVNHIVGELEKATEFRDKAIDLIDKSDHFYKSKVYHISAILHRDMNEVDQGINHADKALKAAEKIENIYQQACVLLTRSELYMIASKFELAKEDMQKAFKIFQLERDKLGISDTYRMFGLYNIFRNNLTLAEANLNVSLEISHNFNNLHSLGEIHIAKALLYTKMKDKQKVAGSIDAARNSFKKIDAEKRIDIELKKWHISP